MPTLPARRDRSRSLRRLVPTEVADAHGRVRAAACLPGILEPKEAITAADDVLLEVAALLAGRAPTSDAQQEFVELRVARLDELAVALGERGHAWREAKREIEALWPIADELSDAPTRDGLLVRAFVLLLSPAFLTWDLVHGSGRAAVTLVEGAIRMIGATWSSLCRLTSRIVRSCVAALRRWREYRARLVAAAREARARVVAARLRLRLRLRRRRAAR